MGKSQKKGRKIPTDERTHPRVQQDAAAVALAVARRVAQRQARIVRRRVDARAQRERLDHGAAVAALGRVGEGKGRVQLGANVVAEHVQRVQKVEGARPRVARGRAQQHALVKVEAEANLVLQPGEEVVPAHNDGRRGHGGPMGRQRVAGEPVGLQAEPARVSDGRRVVRRNYGRLGRQRQVARLDHGVLARVAQQAQLEEDQLLPVPVRLHPALAHKLRLVQGDECQPSHYLVRQVEEVFGHLV